MYGGASPRAHSNEPLVTLRKMKISKYLKKNSKTKSTNKFKQKNHYRGSNKPGDIEKNENIQISKKIFQKLNQQTNSNKKFNTEGVTSLVTLRIMKISKYVKKKIF